MKSYSTSNIPDSTNQPFLNQKVILEKSKELRFDNPKSLSFSSINMNSVRNRFDSLLEIVMGKIDLLIVIETKIDASFRSFQLKVIS